MGTEGVSIETPADLLRTVCGKGVRLWVENGQLRYRVPKGILTTTDVENLKKFKLQIVALLERSNASETSEPKSGSGTGPRHAPLSFQQLAHWNLYQLDVRPSSTPGLSMVRLRGRLHIEALKDSLNDMVRRHEGLRTRIVAGSGIPTQEVLEPSHYDLEIIDFTVIPPDRRDEEVRRLAEEVILQPIHMDKDPLFTARLLRLGELEHVLMTTMEHIVIDGFSIGIFLRDLFSTYTQRLKGLPPSLSPVTMSLAEFAVWQRQTHAAWQKSHGAYWSRCLERYQRVRFPESQPLMEGVYEGWKLARVRIDRTLTSHLHSWCRRNKTTLVLSVFTAYVSAVLRWCRVPEAVFCFETDSRTSPDIENTIGYFASALYVHITLRQEDTFVTLLKQVTEKYCEAYEHADFSFLESQTQRPEFTRSTAFNWVGRGPTVDLVGLGGSEDALSCSRFPFEGQLRNRCHRETEPIMGLIETEDEIEGGVEFPANRFCMQTMEHLAQTFLACVQALTERSDQRIEDLVLP